MDRWGEKQITKNKAVREKKSNKFSLAKLVFDLNDDCGYKFERQELKGKRRDGEKRSIFLQIVLNFIGLKIVNVFAYNKFFVYRFPGNPFYHFLHFGQNKLHSVGWGLVEHAKLSQNICQKTWGIIFLIFLQTTATSRLSNSICNNSNRTSWILF